MSFSLTLLLTFLSPAAQEPNDLAPSPERLAETLETLCKFPRFAGDPQSQHAIDYFASELREAGWQVELKYYWAFLPRQTHQDLKVYTTSGEWHSVDLTEQGYDADPLSLNDHIPPMHGLTGEGSAEGSIWYVGYGTEQEFSELQRKHGDNFKGDIALMRYGALYRGLKIANAEKFGFSGALLYTDAEDDGFHRGQVLPDGPFRPASGIQRGSVFNGNGDALTPGWAATQNAKRLDEKDAPGLVHIPSLPISSATASILIGGHGKKLGNTRAQVKINVEQDRSLQKICNVMATLPGSSHDQQWVILGAHRDAWGRGATDNGTGSTVLLESARIIGQAYKDGWRPQRRLIIGSWDAEEWGLVGSTEWVEENRTELMNHGVAYINLDVAATGPNFSASCTPGLRDTLTATTAANEVTTPARLGVPGGGSDHVPFIEIAGIESMAFGFHGGSGVYHSALDTPYLVDKFLDPGFVHHARATQLALDIVTRLSSTSEIVDGRQGWLKQMRAALMQSQSQPSLSADEIEIVKSSIEQMLAGIANAPAESAFKFHRDFIAPNGKSLIWNSAGYGSAWFPGFNQKTNKKELLRIFKTNKLRADMQ